MTDAEIVHAVLAGDIEAYTGLVDRYRNIVCGLAYHHLQSFEDARDVAQDAFIQAYLHLGQLREPERFGAWLRRVTVNECRMWERRRQPVEPLEEHAVEARRVNEDAVHTRLAVREALECLSDANRLTITLFYYQSRSLQEIAAFLEVPITTVKSRLRNARARLRKEWMQMTEQTFDAQKPDADFTRQIMAFFAAVRANDVERVGQFATEHPSLVHRRYARQESVWAAAEADDARAETALHYAAFHGSVGLARVLLDHGADINAENHDGKSPLELAAWEGGIEVLRTLLEYGPDLARSGAAACYTAAEHGDRDRCELLLAHGAEVDLHTAIMLGMMDRVHALLDADPSLRDAADRRGRSPLDVAAEWGNREIAEILIARGARISLLQAAALGRLETVRPLVEGHPSLVNPTDGSETPLMAAARNGQVEVIRYLLEKGADVHLGQTEYVHQILPIHVASAAAVDPLVAAGADVNVPYRGFTPLQRALSRGKQELAAALRRHGGLKHLHLQCAAGRLELVQPLLDLGADVNEVDEQGRTPLAVVLAKEQDPEVRDPAVRARYTAIAELLRRHGARE